MSDVYYNPEEFGLTLVGEFNWGYQSYDFEIFAVWQGADGALYYGEDSGCSCPSPFENFNEIDSLTPCTLYTLTELLNARLEDRRQWRSETLESDSAKVYELLAKVAKLHFSED